MKNQNMEEGQDFKITANQKRKNRKDYLYKIGKLKENQILCDINHNQAQIEYKDQQKHVKPELNCFQQPQDDFDLEFIMPSLIPQPIVEQQKKEIQSLNLKQVNLEQPSPDGKSVQFSSYNEGEISQATQQDEQKSNRNSEQQIAQAHKLIAFEDFDLDQLQPQIKRQNMGQNKDIESALTHRNQHLPSQQSEQCSQQQIKGVSITTNSLQGNVVIKITNKKQLIFSRIPPGIILKCIIRRSSDIFNPQFDFYLNNGLKHIMSAKKYSLAKKQIFKLSMQLGQYRDRDIICSIMANTVHSTYWIFKQVEVKQKIQYYIKGIVRYNKLVKNKERQMDINLFVDKNMDIKIQNSRTGHQINEHGDLHLKNNTLEGKQLSTKNYVLFDRQDKQYEYLKMNKVSDMMFEVEIQHPLSPLQAFAISLTRFDAELK